MNLNWEVQKNIFDEAEHFGKAREHEGVSCFYEQECWKFKFDNQFEDFDSLQMMSEEPDNFIFNDISKNEDKQVVNEGEEIAQQMPIFQNLCEKGTKSVSDKQNSNTEEIESRRPSMNQNNSVSDSEKDSAIKIDHKTENIQKNLQNLNMVDQYAESSIKSLKSEHDDFQKEEYEEEMRLNVEDPDFDYKAPRKQNFEYNKRKDVIFKTILRKCRRELQDQFNEMTQYFPNRKLQGHQFLKDCMVKFHDSIKDKPEHLDLLFYIGAVLYPQEMSRGVDCFFECDRKDRVKQRKVYRAKIQKVHDVLYRYSHEKMDYFVNVPELSYLFSIFYKKETLNGLNDHSYTNGATEIFERCKRTLKSVNILI